MGSLQKLKTILNFYGLPVEIKDDVKLLWAPYKSTILSIMVSLQKDHIKP